MVAADQAFEACPEVRVSVVLAQLHLRSKRHDRRTSIYAGDTKLEAVRTVWFTEPFPSPKLADCGAPMWIPRHSVELWDARCQLSASGFRADNSLTSQWPERS